MSIAERSQLRRAQALPVLAFLKQWLDSLRPTVMGNSGTAKALAYTLRRWDALVRYIEDGCAPIDNNVAENAIRPIAIGRKNWLFAGSMSLMATANANGKV